MMFRKQRNLSISSDVKEHVIRVSNGNLTKICERECWVRISYNGRAIYRIIRGGGSIVGLKDDIVEIDYNGRSRLRVNNRSADVNVVRVSGLIAHLNHPEEKHRWIVRFSIAALLATVISMIGLFK
jgi:hypothetical protein